MMEDGGVGDKKLLVASDDKGCKEICGRMQSLSKNEE